MKSATRDYALLFFGCLIFHLIGTWSLPLIDRDEPRFAEASREMIERGDYVVPYFNDQFRFDKPPFTYWTQVASYRFFGENDFAARFPSAIAAALVALSIFGWGKRIANERVGWWAAVIFTLSLQTFVHAKAAVADMWLVLFVTLAHWAGYELLFSPRHRKWWWIFYVALAFAFLAKGPIGWTPLLAVGSTLLFLRTPESARRLKFIPGLALMLAIVALWGIPALLRTQGQFFHVGIGRHVLTRSFGAMEGHGANSLSAYLLLLPFYFLTIFASFFPWSIKLPWLARKLWRDRDKIDNYLLGGAAIIFLIFTLVKTKLPHYTLPAFPLLALLLARRWVDNETAISILKKWATTIAAIYVVLALLITPLLASWFPARELFRQSRAYLRPEMQFAAVDFNEPSSVWYFRSAVHGWLSTIPPRKVQPFMEQTGARFVILPTELAQKIYPALPADWKNFSTSGFNIPKGKRVHLTLILKPS